MDGRNDSLKMIKVKITKTINIPHQYYNEKKKNRSRYNLFNSLIRYFVHSYFM